MLSIRWVALLATGLALSGTLGLYGCSGSEGPGNAQRPGTTPEATEDPMSGAGSDVVVMETSKGVVKLLLYPDDAPQHVEAFTKMVRDRFYDGIKFHRVETGFVVQGGDPFTKPLTSAEVIDRVREQKVRPPQAGDLGTGGPGFTIPAEFNQRKHVEGTLAMARSQDPNSAGSQFYLALGSLPDLDGKYTVFGFVSEGMEVVRSIQVGDEIVSATIEPRE